jgi:hypothetical protein
VSVVLNVWSYWHHPGFPQFLAVIVGAVPPLLAAIDSHLASAMDEGTQGKVVTWGLTAAAMGVSAYGIVRTLAPVDDVYAAMVFALVVDGTSMKCLSILLSFPKLEREWARWEAATAERQRLAAEAEQQRLAEEADRRHQAEEAVLKNRKAAISRPVSPPDSTRPASDSTPGSDPAIAADSTPRAASGSTQPGPSTTAAAGSGRAGERQGTPGNVTPLRRPPAASGQQEDGKRRGLTDDEWLERIGAFYDHCVETGTRFSARGVVHQYGGSPNRVGPLVTQFLQDRGNAARGEGAG